MSASETYLDQLMAEVFSSCRQFTKDLNAPVQDILQRSQEETRMLTELTDTELDLVAGGAAPRPAPQLQGTANPQALGTSGTTFLRFDFALVAVRTISWSGSYADDGGQ